jgi:hypothetical protein
MDNGTSDDSPVPAEVKVTIINDLRKNIIAGLDINADTRDAVIQALAIVTKKNISNNSLNTNQLLHYTRTHQQWFNNRINNHGLTNKNYKMMAMITNNTAIFKKQIKKEQLKHQQSVILQHFCDATEEEIKNFKSVHLLASISGIFFEPDVIKEQQKQELVNEWKEKCQQENIHLVYDIFSINFINAHIQQFIDDSQHEKEKQLIRTTSHKSKILQLEPSAHRFHLRKQHKSIRLEVRLNMVEKEEDKSIMGQLKRQLQELVDKMASIDSSLQILPWFTKNGDVPLADNKLPDEKFNLMPKQQGLTYGEFRITIDRRWEDIIFDLTPWLQYTFNTCNVKTQQI